MKCYLIVIILTDTAIESMICEIKWNDYGYSILILISNNIKMIRLQHVLFSGCLPNKYILLIICRAGHLCCMTILNLKCYFETHFRKFTFLLLLIEILFKCGICNMTKVKGKLQNYERRQYICIGIIRVKNDISTRQMDRGQLTKLHIKSDRRKICSL